MTLEAKFFSVGKFVFPKILNYYWLPLPTTHSPRNFVVAPDSESIRH
jgi:hypothetical protein